MLSKFTFVSIPVLGIITQWLSWRFKVPSILFLLIVGFFAGPVFNFLNPDEILGDLLFPIVSLSVAIILFEGGLSLKIADLKHTGVVVRSLITTGVVISCILIAFLAYFLLDLSFDLSILIGAILVVTGPTVIIPLLKQIQVKKSLNSILRWEGIMIDPVGATLAVLIFEVILIGESQDAFLLVLMVIGTTILVGFVFGFLSAFLMMYVIKRRYIPLYLQEVFTLVLVIITYCLSDYLQSESGLLSVTIMGIVLANQRFVVIRHIVSFKENLSILLLTSLFIILAARINISELFLYLNYKTVLFLLGVIFIVRPIVVFVSTYKSNLMFKERLFLGLMAPRGIVAAAVASLFGMRLIQEGNLEAQALVPITFLVIVVTVAFYALFGNLFTIWFNLKPNFKGVIMVGVHHWARALALIFQSLKISVLMVDTNKENIVLAKNQELQVIHGSILSKRVFDEVEMGNFSTFLALTPSDKTNLLGVIEYSLILGEGSVFRLCPSDKSKDLVMEYPAGRLLFGKGHTFMYLSARFTAGARFQMIKMTKSYSFIQFQKEYPDADYLFLITKNRQVLVFDVEHHLLPRAGQTIIFLS